LDKQVSLKGSGVSIPHPANTQAHASESCTLPTPVIADRLEECLIGYEAADRQYLVQGFRWGFKTGFVGSTPQHASKNLSSALEHPDIVHGKLTKELQAGRIAGPFRNPPFSAFCTSPLGLVEKKVPGTYRLIHHLSYPEGGSVNDGIPPESSSVNYQTIDQAIASIKSLGRGCYLAKTGIADAFRIVPLHPSQYPLFGFQWEGQFFYDRCLPMGCSSSCQIFEKLSKALLWISEQQLGIRHMVHVPDDFLILDKEAPGCKEKLDSFTSTCLSLGIPISEEKTFNPSTTMTFLGYELDTQQMEVRLPLDKLAACQHLIEECLKREKIHLWDLQSIIGTLNFACGVILPGRAFLRRLINLTIGVTKPFHFIRITKAMREDLGIWSKFLKQCNGKSLFLPDRWLQSPSVHLYTDAAGSLGYGAVFGPHWFSGAWNAEWLNQPTTLLELYPIVLAVCVWGQQLANQCIYFHTDNQALVDIINKQSSKDPKIMFLVRDLVLQCLKHNILFKSLHVPGRTNILADHLSRLQVDKFQELAPYAHRLPVRLPPLPTLPS